MIGKIKSHTNPPGLPSWPLVECNQPEHTVVVSGKVEDPDVLNARETRLGLALLLSFLVIVGWNYGETLKTGWNDLTSGSIINSLLVGVFLIMVFGLLAGFIYGVGKLINRIALFPWRLSLVHVEFKKEALVVLNPRGKTRRFDLAGGAEIEFRAAPHPWRQQAARDHNSQHNVGLGTSSRFLDASTVDLIYGSEVVRLLSTHDEQSARDFAVCCDWALKHVRGKVSSNATVNKGLVSRPPRNLA